MRDQPVIGWRSQMPAHTIEPDPEYLDTPYLTGMVNVCSALGIFIGAWTAIILIGDLHRGFGVYWSLVLILVIDVALNVGVRIARARKRRALFPEPASARSGGRFQRGAQPGQVG
jgi:hypothetical protein